MCASDLVQAQSDHGYILHAGLHPQVSWALARTGNIQPGDVVCDPMCGKGIVLVEAALNWPDATYLGLDIDPQQLCAAQDNLAKVGKGNPFALKLYLLRSFACYRSSSFRSAFS